MKKTLILLFMLLSITLTMQAQGFSQFHAGAVFPTGKFGDGDLKKGDDYEDGKGSAATGFNVGYKYYSPTSTAGLSLVFGIDVFFNGLNSDYKDYWTDKYDDYDFTFPVYLNTPVTGGINYAYPLNEKLKIYGEAFLGGNLSYMTNFKAEAKNDETEYKYTPAFGFTYGVEGGFFIKDKYSISLKYNNLGSYKFKYEDDDDNKEKFNKSLPITAVTLGFGILF